MSFRKLLILFQICSFGYFVFANPELCSKLIHEGPAAVKVVAANPRLAYKVLMGQVPAAELKQAESPKEVTVDTTSVSAPSMTAADALAAPAVAASAVMPATVKAGVQGDAEAATKLIAKLPSETSAGLAAAEANTPAALSQLPPPTKQLINEKLPESQKKMSDYDKKLQAAYTMSETDGVPASESRAAKTVQPAAVPQKTVVFEVERKEIATRFLHLIVGTLTLRFHVANNMTDKEMGLVAESLKNACLKMSATEVCARNQSTILVDGRFFVDLKETEVVEWASSLVPVTGLVWRLTCANGKDECLKTASRARAFKLSLARANESDVTLARGFETRALTAAVRKVSTRFPATANTHSVSRAYVTRAFNARTSLNDAGSL